MTEFVTADDLVVKIVDPGYVKGTESVSKMPKLAALAAKSFAAVTGRTVEVGQLIPSLVNTLTCDAGSNFRCRRIYVRRRCRRQRQRKPQVLHYKLEDPSVSCSLRSSVVANGVDVCDQIRPLPVHARG